MKKIILFFLTGWLFVASYAQPTITPATALDAYLHNGDPTWAWEVRDQYRTGNTQANSIVFISQKWQNMLWKHELIVFVPEKISYDGALLFITGSSLVDGIPRFSNPDDSESTNIANLADKNQAVTAILRQTPNQPLYDGRYEDALISYTLHEFRNNTDYSLPLLFPMVKSAVRAMDVVQEFAKQQTGSTINRFVVSGSSKRGWTTWLTGASEDSRVEAIAPMVIDILNMPATLADQQKDYNYSVEIADYVALEIPQAINSEFGNALVQMIDPYSYRARLTMPKMIFMGTNDPYWTLDAVKHYLNDIPGENLLCYVANAGHSLGDGQKAFGALSAFFDMTLNRSTYPEYEWTLTEKKKNISFEIKKANILPVRILLWSAESGSRDFRKAKWTDRVVESKNNDDLQLTIEYPKRGFKAFFVELICKDLKGNEYSLTTRPYIAGVKQVY